VAGIQGFVSTKSLFDAYPLGPNLLKNRMVMAPLTRSRAGEGDTPGELNAEYYRQRAAAGLIVTEASQVSKQGQGYLWTPGTYTAQQVAGWKKVTRAVHDEGGKIFVQLWHVGRVSHTTLQPEGQAPLSSTDKAAQNTVSFAYDEAGKPANVPASNPRIASIADTKQVVADYRQAARNAVEAGFDGAEIHGANGYLFDQHLNSRVNERTDEYGRQTKETRTRLVLEAYDAVGDVMGADRVGIRIAPFGSFGGMLPDPDAEETFLYLAEQLGKRGAAYVHIVRGRFNENPVVPDEFLARFRRQFHGTMLVTGGLTQQAAEHLLAADLTDLVGFGSLYIANPDLVDRFRNAWPLNTPNPATFYGGGAAGYTDYPFHGK
jgi:2,4-dienoyl-CoA reductase-like NADH-dependent reductase (Old Yellow Enzyme family)